MFNKECVYEVSLVGDQLSERITIKAGVTTLKQVVFWNGFLVDYQGPEGYYSKDAVYILLKKKRARLNRG